MKRKDGEPEIIFLHPQDREPSRPLSRKWILLPVLLFLGFLVMHNAVPFYTDWLWFQEVGYTGVFTTTVLAKTTLFLGFGLLFFLVFWGNTALARRFAPENADRLLSQMFGAETGARIQKHIGRALLAVGLFLSLWAGRMGAEQWANWLEFTHSTSFGKTDPVFGNDISLYVFRLPFLDFACHFLLLTLLFSGVVAVGLHLLNRAVVSLAGLRDAGPGVRGHLLGLLAALTVIQVFATRLDSYELLNRNNGVFTGAGYADIHYRLFAYNAQILLLSVTAVLCLVSLFRHRSFRWPAIGAGTWVLTAVLLGGVVPGVLQKIVVEPNQLERESAYIARNIAFTRQGFGLEKVRRVDNFPADESLNAASLRANRDTMNNVRLWDYNYLAKIYNQNQNVKTYYRFEQSTLTGKTAHNVDIDRYTIGGQKRQVMLAAREMNSAALPSEAQTWQNRRLSYTHGYGLVMSPVNRVIGGLPDYFVQGFPPAPNAEAKGLNVSRPEIYYGLLTGDYVFVDTDLKEFDYPTTDGEGKAGTQDHYTTYEGKGGIRIGDAPLAKAAFSLRLGDTNVLLARNLKPSSRVLIRRDIRERVMTVAPFVQQDSDPYMVVTDTGRMVWMLDCYTLSDHYPYSTPQQVNVGPMSFIAPNYIRNSVKATVDAYDGTVNLYLSDTNDPVVQTWSKIYPGLLKPIAELPDGLRAHVRYPEDLFRLQRSVYATYHVDDPRVFYLKEDAWAIPNEPNPEPEAAATGHQMEPYYVIMRLPGDEDGHGLTVRGRKSSQPSPDVPRPTPGDEEFLLMSPLAPINREDKNILGWMCARCDGDAYGELVLYRFPQKTSVNGPSQVVSLINSDPVISPQLSLLRQGGSNAAFGNLLVIPVDKSLLYIAPLYIESTNSAKLPQLQKVVVTFGQRVVMEDTLEAALTRLFPPSGENTTPEVPNPSAPPSGSVASPPALRTLIERASSQYDAAQQRLRSGDFAAYGTATKELERTLKELRRLSGGTNSSKTNQ